MIATAKARKRSSAATRLARTIKKYFAPKNIFTREDRQYRLNWQQGLCIVAVSLAICSLLGRFGKFDLSRPILATVISLAIAIRLRWRLRNRLWFWATLIVFIVVAAFLTVDLKWNTNGPSYPIILGLGNVIFYFLFVVLHALELWSKRNSLDRSKRSRSVQI